MSSSLLSIRAASIRTSLLGGVFFAGMLCIAVCITLTGCSKEKKAIGPIRQAYEKGDFAETVMLCERALRDDVDGSDVYAFYGLSLLSLGRDVESFHALKRAAGLDGTVGAEIAEELLAAGRVSYDRGEKSRAALRIRTAAEIDPAIDLGRFGFVVAEACFDAREFERAERFYTAALAEFPDTSVAETALFRLAECRSEAGDSLGAIEVLERQLRLFPVGNLAVQAEWQLVTLLFENARSEFARANYDTAAGILNRVIKRSDNLALVQKSRFMMGECFERKEDFEKAYEQYKAIIDEDLGASGRIVDRSRSKIKTMDEAGLLDEVPNELR
jgi:tetratricopeptide (TPR) repeat protein